MNALPVWGASGPPYLNSNRSSSAAAVPSSIRNSRRRLLEAKRSRELRRFGNWPAEALVEEAEGVGGGTAGLALSSSDDTKSISSTVFPGVFGFFLCVAYDCRREDGLGGGESGAAVEESSVGASHRGFAVSSRRSAAAVALARDRAAEGRGEGLAPEALRREAPGVMATPAEEAVAAVAAVAAVLRGADGANKEVREAVPAAVRDAETSMADRPRVGGLRRPLIAPCCNGSTAQKQHGKGTVRHCCQEEPRGAQHTPLTLG